MSLKDIAQKSDSGPTRARGRVEDLPLIGRKSVLMGMLTSGFVIANAAQPSSASAGTLKPSSIAATQPAYVTKWAPATAYAVGTQITSPNNDVVSANVAHTSASAFTTDTAKWNLSSTVCATFSGKSSHRVNVWDYGAIGDGIADDASALQRAINAAGAGGYIECPLGTKASARFMCLTGLTMLNFQTLDGASTQVGVGGSAAVEIRFPSFTGAQVGLTMGESCVVKNLCLRGPGSAVGTCTGIYNTSANNDTGRLHNVQMIHWNNGLHLNQAYYWAIYDSEFSRNTTGLLLTACYNVFVSGTRFMCHSSNGTTYNNGISTGTVRGLTVHGGSIEGYGPSGAFNIGAGSNVLVEGVYFESSVAGTNAWGFAGSTPNKTSLTLVGNTVYLAEHSRWVGWGGAASSNLISHGNYFVCGSSSVTPTAYVFGTISGTMTADIFGDHWDNVAIGTYADNSANWPVAGFTIRQPLPVATHGTQQYFGRNLRLPTGKSLGMNGKTPPAIAASPGVAAGTDASVINAIVTALRNFGLVT